VTALKESGLSERCACGLVDLDRSTFRYQAQTDPLNERLRSRMKELGKLRQRRGCPWMYQRLRKEGFAVNHKRIERLYKLEDLNLPCPKRRPRYRGPQVARPRAEGLNHLWAADFIEDGSRWNRKIRILNLLDECSRWSIDMEVSGSITGRHVVRFMDRAIEVRGAVPEILILDHGPEFICSALADWAQRHGVRIHFTDKGKPTQNCFVESFHSTMRREFLDLELFSGVGEAREGAHEWRMYYNEEREHSSLGWLTPLEFEIQLTGER